MKGNLNDGVLHKEKSLRLMGYIVRLHPGNMSIRAETWGVGGGRDQPFYFDPQQHFSNFHKCWYSKVSLTTQFTQPYTLTCIYMLIYITIQYIYTLSSLVSCFRGGKKRPRMFVCRTAV